MVPRWKLATRVRASDVVAIAAVPAVLVGVFALPQSVKWRLALAYADPTWLTAYTMHFVHVAEMHLLTNLLGYLLIVPLAYLFSVLSGRRRLFWTSFVTFLVAFPFALSGLNVLLTRPRVGVGFSGINMAFLGLLSVTWTAFVGRRLVSQLSLRDAPLLFFGGVASIGLLAASYARTVGIVGGVAFVAGVGYLAPLAADREALAAARRAVHRSGDFELAVWGIGVSAVFLVGAFPANPLRDGAVLNVFMHLLGYCLGFIVPYAAAGLFERYEPSVRDGTGWTTGGALRAPSDD